MRFKRRNSILMWVGVVLVAILSAGYALARAGYLPAPAFITMKRPAPLPKPADTRDGRWRQTVEYLGSQLPYLHVNPFFKINEAEFQQHVTDLAENVPDLKDEQIVVAMMRLVASVGDGHTRIYARAETNFFTRLPLELRWFDDELIVIAASTEYERAVGTKVVQIGAHPAQDVYEAVKPLVSADNEMQILNDIASYMTMPALLYGLELIPQPDSVAFRFEGKDGSQFDLELRPISGDPGQFISVYEKAGAQLPLYEQDRESFYWVRDLPEADAVYVQYNACREQKGKSFQAFVEEVFEMVDRSQETRLVLDLRFNGGGNEAVIAPLIEALKARSEFNQPGKLFVIIGRGTYSSALQNAITLRRENNAILVGEPTGGKPNHFGEVRNFGLPNVELRVQYSTRYWLNYPEGDPLTLDPDVSAVVTFADLLAGRDPALEAALQP